MNAIPAHSTTAWRPTAVPIQCSLLTFLVFMKEVSEILLILHIALKKKFISDNGRKCSETRIC